MIATRVSCSPRPGKRLMNGDMPMGVLLVQAETEVRRPEGPGRLSLDYANQEIASATARGQLAYYELLERRGLLRMIRSAGDLKSHWERWRADDQSEPIGYILAMEGADPIV